MKEYILNNQEKVVVGGKSMYPTLLTIPRWDILRRPPNITLGALSIPTTPPRLAMVTPPNIQVIGDYSEIDLCSAPSDPHAPATMSYNAIKGYIEEKAPIEDPAIVEWMHISGAQDLICEMTQEEYRRAGSNLVGKSEDGNIPGSRVEDIMFRSENGTTVAQRGYAVVETPRGNINIPVPGKKTIIFKDLLCFGAVSNAWPVQWSATLLKWKTLTTNPSSRIRFPSFSGLVAPQFIKHEPGAPFITNFVIIDISTDKDQTMKAIYRETGDYTQEITSVTLNLRKGRNKVSYNILIFPYVPTMVTQLVPEDMTSTILNSYEVKP